MKYGILLAFLVLCGCSTTPVPPDQAASIPSDRVYAQSEPGQDKLPVQVTRDEGGTDSRFCGVILTRDNKKLATFKPGETATFYVEPGKHVFAAKQASMMCGFGTVETVANVTQQRPTSLRIYIPFKAGLHISETAY